MNKHTYRPDMKSVVERVMGTISGRSDLNALLDVEKCVDEMELPGWSAPTTLGVAELADVMGRTLGSYSLHFEASKDRADQYRPMLVCGNRAVAVDVFVRRHGTSGEA